MRIITTPMCKKILELAGIKHFDVATHPNSENYDLVILLSENKVSINSLNLKLNTFSQIKDSIKMVSNFSSCGTLTDIELSKILSNYKFANKWLCNDEDIVNLKNFNSNISVNVWSNFLKDIVKDMGFNVSNNSFEYLIYPDYMENKIENNLEYKLIQMPTHHNVSEDPIERAELRYFILSNISNF